MTIQSNLRTKKLHRMNQDTSFLGSSLNDRDNVRALIQFGKESQPQHLKRLFFIKNRPIHFHINSTSVFSQSNETKWVYPALESTSHFLPQCTVSCRWDSSSEANSSCCHRSDAWLHLVRVESSMISIDSNITDDIKKVINVWSLT